MARQQGFTEAIADLVDDGYESSTLDERQKATLRWTDAVLNLPSTVEPDVRTGIEQFLSQAELVELTLGLVLGRGMASALISLGLEPEAMDTTVIPTPGTVG